MNTYVKVGSMVKGEWWVEAAPITQIWMYNGSVRFMIDGYIYSWDDIKDMDIK